MNDYLDLDALWRVLATGLVGGAGLVAVYALGLAGLSAAGRRHGGGRSPWLLLAGTCFLIVAAGGGAGLYLMLSK